MTTLLARGQITIAAIKDGTDGKPGKDYWQQDVWIDLSAATYDQNTWYTVVGEMLSQTGFVGIKVVVNLNSGTKPSWSTHSAGFSVDFHIDTQASGWGTTLAETIIYSDTFNFCPVSPVSYKQLGWGSRPILYLRGGGKYRVFSTYNAAWKIYKDGYTWQSGQYSQSAMPSNSRPTPDGHTLKGDKGDKGENGTDGEDAISILVENTPLIFDTNENGTVPVGISKAAKVKVMKGNRNVTNDCTSVSSRDDLCSNCRCGVTKKDEYIEVSILSDSIIKNDVIDNGVNKGQVSATSGFAVAQATYNGVTYFAQVPFSVNVAKFTGVVAFNNKQYEAKFTEISNRFDNTPTNKDLKESESRMIQTAREISLSVSEKIIGRRNLLVGSAFNRQEGFGLNLDANTKGYGILMNDGVDGMNCIKVASYYDGTLYQYCGAFWGGSWTGKNIRIKHETKYTLSCWVKVDTPNTFVALEVLYEKAESGSDRDGGPSGGYFTINEANKWQLIKRSFTTDNTHNWIEANVYTCSSIKGQTFVAWFCKPMLEEGDYNGWTLSTEDYDYIGGNMLDNTLSLDKSGTLYEVNGTLTPLGFGESVSIYKSFTYKLKGIVNSFSQLPTSGNTYGDTYCVRNTEICYRYNGSEFESVGNDYYYNMLSWRKSNGEPFGLEANKDYVFSFMAKGTGKLTAYFWNPDTNVFIEDSLGGTDISVNGQANFQLTSEWKRYWVHWRPSDNEHKNVLLRLNRTVQSSAGDAPITDCYIAQPKLEAGAVVTEYTERKSDLVDKASLKAAGINIGTDYVEIYGDKVKVSQTEGGTPIALFADGKINAQLINATNIVTEGLQAQTIDAKNATLENLNVKNVHVTGSLRNPFVDYDNHMDNNYTDNVIIYDMYNKNLETDYELLWDSSQNGRLIRIANIYSLLDRPPAATAIFTAPKMQCFFENGLMKETLHIGPSQIVELLGIGDINYGGKHIIGGWVVMNRINLLNENRFRVSNVYGNKLGIILMGTSESIFAFDSVDTNIMYERTSDKRFKFEKTGNGVWELKYPSEWVDNKYMWANDELAIQVTCTAPGCYATSHLGIKSLTITTYKGTSPTYDTSFYFEVKNMLEMLPIV